MIMRTLEMLLATFAAWGPVLASFSLPCAFGRLTNAQAVQPLSA